MNAKEKNYWHPAQYAAIQIELEDYADSLTFGDEYQLTQEPLRIDVYVIKKDRNVEIKKNIGRIFRAYNLIEFKSQFGYISVADFHKVNAYGFHYMSINGIRPTDLTLTLISRGHPQALFSELEELGCEVKEVSRGIYHVLGFGLIPIQVIETQLLDDDENLWLKSLVSDIKDRDIVKKILTKYQEKEKNVNYNTYLSTVLKANPDIFLEVIESMNEALLKQAVTKVFIEKGWLEEVQRETEQRKATEMAKNLLSKGMHVADIVDVTGLSMAEIEALRRSH